VRTLVLYLIAHMGKVITPYTTVLQKRDEGGQGQ